VFSLTRTGYYLSVYYYYYYYYHHYHYKLRARYASNAARMLDKTIQAKVLPDIYKNRDQRADARRILKRILHIVWTDLSGSEQSSGWVLWAL
jgi:hypothetical protein